MVLRLALLSIADNKYVVHILGTLVPVQASGKKYGKFNFQINSKLIWWNFKMLSTLTLSKKKKLCPNCLVVWGERIRKPLPMADSHGGHISRASLPPSIFYLFNTHSFILPFLPPPPVTTKGSLRVLRIFLTWSCNLKETTLLMLHSRPLVAINFRSLYYTIFTANTCQNQCSNRCLDSNSYPIR